jgi:hypothetical protein
MTMKCAAGIALGFCLALLVVDSAAAQPAVTRNDKEALPGIAATESAAGDCALAKDPLRCEARRKARDDCKGLRSGKRRQCLAEHQSPIDCSRADNPRRCEAQLAASEACRNKSGAQHRQCLREQLK